jgi:ribonuclease R
MGRKNSKKKKQKVKQKQAHPKLLKGILEITRSGMGFVTIEGIETDILIKSGDFNTALHGDTVLVAIKEQKSGGRRMQGVVKEVLQRKRNEFIGHLEISKAKAGEGPQKSFGFFIAAMDKPMPDIFIPSNKFNGAKNKDKVVVRLVSWDNSGRRPEGEVVSVLKEEEGNDAAMKEILLEEGFPLEFSEEALEIAARIPDSIGKDEIRMRKDMRDVLTFTIDPVDAKDFDDAISIRHLKNGHIEVGVHIADVSHFVDADTELDKEAYGRATSVYLPDRVNPMLPEHISNCLCSLRPKEVKLTFSVIFQLNHRAEVKQYWLGKTVIHSDHRFTYEEVQAIIEEKAGLYADEILLLNDLAQRMRKKTIQSWCHQFFIAGSEISIERQRRPGGNHDKRKPGSAPAY